MTNLIHSKSEISSEFKSTNFVVETCAQVNKDIAGISDQLLEFSVPIGANPLNELIEQLVEIIRAIESLEKLAQFVYRVDLNENEFKQALKTNNWHDLAFSIIRREAQKVFLKHKFRTT